MSKKVKEWARKARYRLIYELGGKCANSECGEEEYEKLDFDHIDGKDWETTGLSTDQRILRYRKEAKLGLLQVMCHVCNAKKGDPRLISQRQRVRLVAALGNVCATPGCQNNYVGDLCLVLDGNQAWQPALDMPYEDQLAFCRKKMAGKKLVIFCSSCLNPEESSTNPF